MSSSLHQDNSPAKTASRCLVSVPSALYFGRLSDATATWYLCRGSLKDFYFFGCFRTGVSLKGPFFFSSDSRASEQCAHMGSPRSYSSVSLPQLRQAFTRFECTPGSAIPAGTTSEQDPYLWVNSSNEEETDPNLKRSSRRWRMRSLSNRRF